jgi:inner membrane protein
MRALPRATVLVLKLFVIGVLGLALWIPTAIIGSLVRERSHRRDEVVREVSSTWGQEQVIEGPILSVPFEVWEESSPGIQKRRVAWIHQLPDRLDAGGRLEPEIRYRSIYEVVLYLGFLRLEGSFPPLDVEAWGVNREDVLWERAVLTFAVSDLKGLREVPELRVNGESLLFAPGTGEGPFGDGLGASIPFASSAGAAELSPVTFEIDVEFAGSESLRFLPIAGQTNVELTAPWPDPSFDGSFLPLSRTVSADGFEAEWRTLALHREVPQRWSSLSQSAGDYAVALRGASFGIELLSPVDAYRRTMRSVKYSVLFSLLTFLGFFAVEVGGRSTIHPAQYVIIGFALCLFYTLLLSLSELCTFNLAYFLASSVIVVLVSAYIHGIVRRKSLSLLCSGVLAVVYGSLFLMLQLEELALLMGTALLVVLCAVVMFLTRRLTWERPNGGTSSSTSKIDRPSNDLKEEPAPADPRVPPQP